MHIIRHDCCVTLLRNPRCDAEPSSFADSTLNAGVARYTAALKFVNCQMPDLHDEAKVDPNLMAHQVEVCAMFSRPLKEDHQRKVACLLLVAAAACPSGLAYLKR